MRLIEYLEHARKLENDIYLCDVTINNLENRILELEREREQKINKVNIMMQDPPRLKSTSISKPEQPKNNISCGCAVVLCTVIGLPLGLLFLIYSVLGLVSVSLGTPATTGEIILLIVLGIISPFIVSYPLISVIRDKKSEQKDYENMLEKYEEECCQKQQEYEFNCNEHNQTIQYWKTDIENSHYDDRIANIRKSIAEIQNIKNSLKIPLEKVYSYNIVYPKYRELVPITMFCEYLASGRCNTLEGHEGAYNIYENELRQNIIISKLDTIASKLNSIRSSQYLLYTAISDSNRLSGQIINSISSYSDQQARANALQELSNKAILDSNRALQELGQKSLDELKKING